MVKNTKGGNRHKKMARKHVTDPSIKIKTRLANPKEPCEVYATVTKVFGQGNCEVLCSDGVLRLCVIRKIFKGRNKSRNYISIDTKVLVGLRDWETGCNGKREKCDLLEVYDMSQYKDIKNDPRCNWSVIASTVERDMIKSGAQDMFVFGEDDEEKMEDDKDDDEKEEKKENVVIKSDIKEKEDDDDDEITLDDI